VQEDYQQKTAAGAREAGAVEEETLLPLCTMVSWHLLRPRRARREAGPRIRISERERERARAREREKFIDNQ
jgi:hypothetical protein